MECTNIDVQRLPRKLVRSIDLAFLDVDFGWYDVHVTALSNMVCAGWEIKEVGAGYKFFPSGHMTSK